VVTDPPTNPQTGPITIHCAAKLTRSVTISEAVAIKVAVFDLPAVTMLPELKCQKLSWPTMTCCIRRHTGLLNCNSNVKQAVGGRPPRYAPAPVRAGRTLRSSYSPYTPGLRRPARLAFGPHEYSRCTRQTSDRQTSLLNAPA